MSNNIKTVGDHRIQSFFFWPKTCFHVRFPRFQTFIASILYRRNGDLLSSCLVRGSLSTLQFTWDLLSIWSQFRHLPRTHNTSGLSPLRNVVGPPQSHKSPVWLFLEVRTPFPTRHPTSPSCIDSPLLETPGTIRIPFFTNPLLVSTTIIRCQTF